MTNEEYFNSINKQLNSMAKPPVKHTGVAPLPAPAGRTKEKVNIPAQVRGWYNKYLGRMNGTNMQQPPQVVDANGLYAMQGQPLVKPKSKVMEALGNINSAFKDHEAGFNAGFDPLNGAQAQTPMGTVGDIVTAAKKDDEEFKAIMGGIGNFVKTGANQIVGGAGDIGRYLTSADAIGAFNNNVVDRANAVREANGNAFTMTPTDGMSPSLSPATEPPVAPTAINQSIYTGLDNKRNMMEPNQVDINTLLGSAGLTGDDVNITNRTPSGIAFKEKKDKRVSKPIPLRDINGNETGTGYMTFAGGGNVGGIPSSEVLGNLIKRRNARLDKEIMADKAKEKTAASSSGAVPEMMSYAEALGKTSSGRPKSIEEALVSMRLAKNVLSQDNRRVRSARKQSREERKNAIEIYKAQSALPYRAALAQQAIALANSYPSAEARLLNDKQIKVNAMIGDLLEKRAEAVDDETRYAIDQQIAALASGKVNVMTDKGKPKSSGFLGFGSKPAIPPTIKTIELL